MEAGVYRTKSSCVGRVEFPDCSCARRETNKLQSLVRSYANCVYCCLERLPVLDYSHFHATMVPVQLP